SSLMELGLILFLITTLVLAASRLLIARMTLKEGKH
ncbi:MAG: phosphate ABC transporter permease subunit PstC, partial [[Actinobacillus] rossii]|nr:phosphate ABC transporter permease subunit PstC [[Actinobacillus] rossii]